MKTTATASSASTLVEFVSKDDIALEEKWQLYAKVSEAWNKLDESNGTFGAEHSPL